MNGISQRYGPFSQVSINLLVIRFVCVAVERCEIKPCLNGGTCDSLALGYHCDCIVHFEGIHCEYRESHMRTHARTYSRIAGP